MYHSIYTVFVKLWYHDKKLDREGEIRYYDAYLQGLVYCWSGGIGIRASLRN